MKVHLRFHFKKHKQLQRKYDQKDKFDLAFDGPLDGAVKGVPIKFRSLRALYILYSAEQTELLIFSN